MKLNPFNFVTYDGVYKENFLIWQLSVWQSFTGSFGNFGFLDYIFVLPGLVKLVCNPEDKSLLQKTLCGFSNFLSIFKHLTAFVLTLAFIPLTFIAYKYIRHQGDKLKNIILESEVLPVDAEKLKNLEYLENYRGGSINKKKLFNMFYENNSVNRIKFKDHPNLELFLRNGMERYMIRAIHLETDPFYKRFLNKRGKLLGEKIFGLYPCTACYCGFSSSGHDADIEDKALPAILIIPSKENRKELLAIKKFDAFFFSKSSDENRPLEDNIDQYTTQDDPLKKIEQFKKAQRRTIQFSLNQALKGVISENPELKEIERSIDSMIPMISGFADTGELIPEDIDFTNRFNKKYRNSIFYGVPVPVAHSPEHKSDCSEQSNAQPLSIST